MSKPAIRHSTPTLLCIALLALALVPGCKKADAASSEAAPRGKADTVQVGSVTVPDVLLLTGTLRGERETDLAANVSGRVTAVLVERGRPVQRGAVIARVDVQSAALQLAEARVQIETTKTQQEIDQVECARYEKLKERGAVTDLEYTTVMARCKKAPLGIEAAQARANLAAKSVGDGVIRAPFAGVVTDRFIEVGEYVQPSTRVVALADVSALRLEFSVPEANYPSIKLGASVDFEVIAYGERHFQGKVSYLGGAIRPTRDVIVEASLDNADGTLLPGMFAKVRLPRGTTQLPAVPPTALFVQNGKTNLFVVEAGVLSQRVVQVEAAQGALVPIRRGIAIGEKVVAPHRAELTNGMLVD